MRSREPERVERLDLELVTAGLEVRVRDRRLTKGERDPVERALEPRAGHVRGEGEGGGAGVGRELRSGGDRGQRGHAGAGREREEPEALHLRANLPGARVVGDGDVGPFASVEAEDA